MDYGKEISYGAFDSELMHQEIFIPEGFEATIDGNKIILTRKDSEDERIRKELIGYIVKEVGLYPGEDRKEHKWLRWLEKQGKEDSSIQQAYEWGYTEGKRIERKHWIEKQEFSKDYNNIDPHFGKPINKVEPKFKVGKWYIDNEDGTIFQIVKVLNNTYTYKTNEGKEYSCSHYSLENDAHLWTIQDAKDGDFLACPLPKGDGEQVFIFKETNKREYIDDCIEYYCRVCQGVFYESNMGFMGTASDEFKPATQEQRTLLIQKMHEAGYEWNPDKKKLEKKPKRMVSAEAKEALLNESEREALRTEYEKGRADAIAQMQKKWSEEDEKLTNRIEGWLDTLCDYLKDSSPEYIEDVKNIVKQLKSLKERYIWKPSDEQITVLELASKYERVFTPKQIDILIGLKEQLKKLKG